MLSDMLQLLKFLENSRWLYKIDVSFKTAGRFIDLETFIRDQDDDAFVKATIKPRLPFLKIPEKVKAFAVALYMIESNELKANYPWIYAPPSFPNQSEITTGSIEREAFAKTYGGYMEMVYLCADQEVLKFDEVFKMPTEKFLFLSEYLIRKRTVENLK
jgi:hypothetical protein